MKKHLRNYATSALLLLPAAVSLLALPSTVLAQPAAPEVRSLDIDADAGLEPGSSLRFKLAGTPHVKAHVRIQGLRQNIVLREVRPGVYVGRYTLKRADRLAPDAEVRAMLTRGNRTIVASYELGQAMNAPAVVTAPPPPPVPVPPPLRIERFGMVPIERIEPGAELQFALDGMPGAQVSVDLPGVERDLRLRETRPGHYEGSYTIRRSDDIRRDRPVVATLKAGDRTVSASIGMMVGRQGAENRDHDTDHRPPGIAFLVPSDGATVAGGASVHVAGTFQDAGGSGVDPDSVRVTISGRNVTREAQITRQSFSYWGPLPAGRHTVDVSARDHAGNIVHKGWSFEVAAAAPANLPVQVLNHTNNEQVDRGQTLVQARTAPNASVAVKVQAIAPLGGVLNISQTLFAQTLQADGNGNFGFTFVPQLPIPGTRYDVTMVSTKGELSLETTLSLYQR